MCNGLKAGKINQCIVNREINRRFSECIAILSGVDSELSFIYLIYLFSHLADACPKQLTNEDNRSNQNQQKSKNMQVL